MECLDCWLVTLFQLLCTRAKGGEHTGLVPCVATMWIASCVRLAALGVYMDVYACLWHCPISPERSSGRDVQTDVDQPLAHARLKKFTLTPAVREDAGSGSTSALLARLSAARCFASKAQSHASFDGGEARPLLVETPVALPVASQNLVSGTLFSEQAVGGF